MRLLPQELGLERPVRHTMLFNAVLRDLACPVPCARLCANVSQPCDTPAGCG